MSDELPDDFELGLAEQFGIGRTMAALDSQEVLDVLVNHHRKDIKGCACGWSRPGHSHAAHVLGEIIAVVRAAVERGKPVSDLHAALLEAITARQRRAQIVHEAEPGAWNLMLTQGKYWVADANGDRLAEVATLADADLIVNENPAAVLRQCERDLKVLTRHAAHPAGEKCGCADVLCSVGEHNVWPCDEIVDLANAYAIPVDATAGQTPGC